MASCSMCVNVQVCASLYIRCTIVNMWAYWVISILPVGHFKLFVKHGVWWECRVQQQDVRDVWFHHTLLTQSTNASLAACPWKSYHCEIPHREGLFCAADCVLLWCIWIHACIFMNEVPCAAGALSLDTLSSLFSTGLYAPRSEFDCWSLELPFLLIYSTC